MSGPSDRLLEHARERFAVQGYYGAAHMLAEIVASEPLIKDPPTGEPSFYYDLLRPVAASLDIWYVEYLQVLVGEDPVAEFVKGSWLPQCLEALEEPHRREFEAEYRARLRAAYPKRADGATLFPFKRLFIVARL